LRVLGHFNLVATAGKSPGSLLNDRQSAGAASPRETFQTQEEHRSHEIARTVEWIGKKKRPGRQAGPLDDRRPIASREASAIAEARAQENA
jgi:hypothetical protein